MGKVFVDISVSLDGFIAGPNLTRENPLGDGGERLHEWVVELASWRAPHGLEGGATGPDDEIMRESFENQGAVVMGRGMFGGGDGPWGDPAWGDQPWEGWWGDDPPFHVPVFVLTHHAREPVAKQGGTTFTFVTDGIEAALKQAREAAGDKDIWVAGGANVIQQYLAAGLLDEIQVHVVPILLGDGTRLFDDLAGEPIQLEKTRVIDSPGVTHLKFRVAK
jgi:dihydrofolate reductase